MTEQLYYKDPYIQINLATVVNITREKKWTALELDSTIFYPEGGGQPGDRGTIAGVPVINTVKAEGSIVHLVKSLPASISVGTRVEQQLDWEHRFDYMQQHSGQHLLSGVFYEAGYNTLSVHQGEDYTTIEFDKDSLSDQELITLEEKANLMIQKKLSFITSQEDSAREDSLNLRRPAKVKGAIRIVEIDGADKVACGGVHLSDTGQIGIIALAGTEKIRGHLRTIWKIGNRAYNHYRILRKVTDTLGTLLSSPAEELPRRVESMIKSGNEASAAIETLEKRLARKSAEELIEAGQQGQSAFRLHNLSKGEFRQVLEIAAEDSANPLLLVNSAGNLHQWGIADPEGILDFNRLKNEVLPNMGAKGGGRAPVYQGVVQNPENIEVTLELFKNFGR